MRGVNTQFTKGSSEAVSLKAILQNCHAYLEPSKVVEHIEDALKEHLPNARAVDGELARCD